VTEGPRAGEEFAGYRIERQLGRGGMGVVFLVEHVRLGRKAALKVLAPEWAEQEGFQERFVRESRLAASLDHPNIVPVYDAGEQDGVLYIAMRFVEGTDLASVIDAEPGGLEPERALSIVRQIADALDAAHAEGLVHRDVKPGNVLIGSPTRPGGREWAYLTDFGLTKQIAAKTRLTRTGMFMGTLDYVAPEQIRGDELDGRADEYALACMLFETLTGRPPFAKDAELAVIHSHLTEPPPAASSVRVDLPVALDDVLARGMAKLKGERFATCTELLEAATAAVEGRMVPASDLPAPPPQPPTAPSPAEPTRPPEPSPAARRRPGRWVLVAGVIALLAAAGGVFALTSGGRDEPTPSGPTGAVSGTTGASGALSGATGDSGSAPPSGVFRIAFSADRNGAGDLFVANSDGSDVRTLAEGTQADAQPSWSPDGTEIAFTSDRDGDLEIYVMVADGSNVVRLTDDPEGQTQPAWSPDGTRIAYANGGFTPDSGIYVMNAEGSEIVRLTDGDFDIGPAWSPDGTQIAFTRFGDATSEIVVMNADGSEPVVLGEGSEPSWSPDGTKIVFSKGAGRDPSNIFVMGADGSGIRRLTTDIGIDDQPVWSPDGTQIVFTSTRDSAQPDCEELCLRDLYVMNADGTDVIRLFDDPFSVAGPSTTA